MRRNLEDHSETSATPIRLARVAALWAALATAALSSGGCALVLLGGGAAAGAGAVAYAQGELSSPQAASLDTTWEATRTALRDMRYTITEQEKGERRASLTARGPDEEKVTIGLEAKSSNVTEIRIRVGMFGDETVSRQILAEIEKRL